MESKQDGKANRMGWQIEWEGQQDGKAKQYGKANRVSKTGWEGKQIRKANRMEESKHKREGKYK